ncbi:MAG: catalase [Bacteroidetes bacterium]|nr:catalase [Bacteroidota bacterium]
MERRTMTTAEGRPVANAEDSVTAGPRGPVLMQDYLLAEKMAHFNRERIPERVVHAKGSGAYGTFTVTNDITRYTKARIFANVGNRCRAFVRFSTVGGEQGSADTERDPRGFAVRLYTEVGNWDIVGNNTPVFFIRDPMKFSDFIHTQKRDPRTHCKSPAMMWDFWSLNPESLHQVTILFSSRGTPYGYRHMDGFGSHTFSFINAEGTRVWTKFHFKTEQRIRNFTAPDAEAMKGHDPDFAQRELVDAIDRGEYPRWLFKVQIMTESQAEDFPFNPFDVTKVWPHADFPLIDVGVLELNEIPENYFAHVEQAAFAPANLVDGVGFSPDKMLQGRILSYPDAHRYRLGVNYVHLPVNRCPYGANTYHRDGAMQFTENGGGSANYYPNSFNGPGTDAAYAEPAFPLSGEPGDRYDRNAGNDDYTQPGNLYRLMSPEERAALVQNIAGSMSGIAGEKREEIINRQLCHFFRADPEYGTGVAQALGMNVEDPTAHFAG